jgi:Xaa-Pro aminopeptidase
VRAVAGSAPAGRRSGRTREGLRAVKEPGTFVIVDIGCRLDGYCSDCTRTFATGALSEEAAAVYAVVLDAASRGRVGT